MAQAATGFVRVLAYGLILAWPLSAAAEALDPRLEAVVQQYREAGAEPALPAFEELAIEFARESRTRDEAAALHYVGECHWRLGHFPEARRRLERALTLETASGDRLAQGKTLNVMGLLSWDEGDYERAIAAFRQAGDIARETGDLKLQGASLNNLSLVYDEQGDYDGSLDQYRQVLALYQGADFPRGVGDTLGNIGGVHLLLGHFREALGYYRQALAISEQLKSVTSMSQDHGNIGLCLLGLGEIDEALAHLDEATQLARQAGMQQDQAYWLRVKADGLVEQGHYDLALQNYRTALSIYEEVGAQAELVHALQGFGRLHLLLGDSTSAEREFRRAHDVAQAIGLDRGVTMSLVSLGDMEVRRDRPDAARAVYEQARQRAAGTGLQQVQALALLRLARVNRSRQELTLAVAQTDEAAAIAREIGASNLEAEALYSRAELARLKGEYTKALENYGAAEKAGASIGDPDLLWQVQYGRARTQEATGDASAAVQSLEAAINIIEGVRSRLQEQRFRSGYVEDKFDVYLELIRLQLELGRTPDAFSTAERLRARSFTEQLGGRASVPLSAMDRRTEMELRERVRRLQEAIIVGDDEGESYPQRALHHFSEELIRAESEYATFLDDHARTNGADASPPTATSIQRRLAANEALIEYVVAPDSLIVFVLTSREIAVQSAPLHEEDLAARISLLRDLIQHPDDDRWHKPAARLWAQLVGGIEQTGALDRVDRLLIVPHGVLTLLPFAVLPRAEDRRSDLLIDRYTIVYLPAAAALLRKPLNTSAEASLLAVVPARGGLRYAPEEARIIDAMFRPNSRTLIGADATEGRFKQIASDYRMLHMATHGHFNEINPLLSGLELEPDHDEDGMLHVHEVLDLRLHADLVTLSACETALGTGYFTGLPKGDEFIGLNRAFLAAGSVSVMATLWQVDDRAAVSLMEKFYRDLNTSGGERNAADALAFAQRTYRRSSELGHPYYWASYVVIGQINPEVEVASESSRRML